MKRLVLGAVLLAGVAVSVIGPASPAAAHPLGNFSVNQLAALSLYPDRVEVNAVVDFAELPTLQSGSTMDGSVECPAFASAFDAAVEGKRLMWTVRSAAVEYAEGAAGLRTSRLTCSLSSPAVLDSPARMRVNNNYRSGTVGWHELTAVGSGVRLVDSPVPTVSRTGGDLRSYPTDLLDSPVDVRSASLSTAPGSDPVVAGAAVARPTSSGVSRWVAGADRVLADLVGERGLSPLVGVLAVLLALVLGAAHAALPGHGKTIMAAFLAGKRGRVRDAVAVGAVVTLTHTGGVLAMGLLLTTVAGLSGETVLGWLGVASGALVVVVGAAMLAGLRRRRHHSHTHSHAHSHSHDHGRPRRWSIAGIGIAGGLVPSPSALVVLLGAIALGRTPFGVLLVLAYGLGMAATLTAAGLLLVGLQRRLSARFTGLAARVSAWAPAATGSLVLLVGLGLLGRAAATI